MKQKPFSLYKQLSSFKHAFNGLNTLFKEEHNARIHLFATIVVVAMGILLDISRMEWAFIVFSIGFVITKEIINTAIENICDFVSPEKHHIIKKIKDLSAGAVFISATTAAVVGFIIFLPKLI
ncbi:diacylglycerol kinase family protein [Labilibacter sediminis]|nr:diacylglycerol kinase family protein [Labilibacter sediminis]